MLGLVPTVISVRPDAPLYRDYTAPDWLLWFALCCTSAAAAVALFLLKKTAARLFLVTLALTLISTIRHLPDGP